VLPLSQEPLASAPFGGVGAGLGAVAVGLDGGAFLALAKAAKISAGVFAALAEALGVNGEAELGAEEAEAGTVDWSDGSDDDDDDGDEEAARDGDDGAATSGALSRAPMAHCRK